MPRAGSTLLQNVLGQNSEFYVTPTSGVLELLFGARSNFSQSPEFKAQDFGVVAEGFKSFCRNGLEGYYKGVTDKGFVVDKSRGWAIHYDFINAFYPKPKIICMVRDLRTIVSSYIKKERENSILDTGKVDHGALINTTIIKRVNDILNKPPIGLALNRMYDIIHRGIDKNILFVEFENFCKAPHFEMVRIYEYLGLEYPDKVHDFENVHQLTYEDDEIYGIRNLHNIRRSISPVEDHSKKILGEELCEEIYTSFEWYFNYFGYAK